MRHFLVRATAVAALIAAACASTIDLYFSASPEQIREQAKKMKPALWKVPLGPASIQEMQFIAPGRLLVSLKRMDSAMSNRECLLVDTERGTVLWRFDREEQGDYNIVLALDDLVLFRRDHGSRTALIALDASDGKVRWNIPAGSPSSSVLSYPEDRMIVVVDREDSAVRFSVHDLRSGNEVWNREVHAGAARRLPLPLVVPEGFIHFYDGTEMVSLRTGKSVWKQDGIRPGPDSPPALLSGGQLLLVDGLPALQVLNARSGQKVYGQLLEQGIAYTNISVSRDTLYLRGAAIAEEEKPYKVIALRRADGKRLWTYEDREPSVSNIVEHNDRVYFATSTSLIGLHASGGRRFYKVAAAQTGRTYPVQVRAMQDKIVFISEVVIAAFDPVSGSAQYSHGMTPNRDLEGLDILIRKNEQELRSRQGQQQGVSWSQYYGQEAARYQNIASSNYRESSRLSSENKYAESDAAFSRASASRNLSKAYALMSVQTAITELGNAIAEAMKNAEIRGSIAMYRFLYGTTLAAYQAAEEGDYVYRPHVKGIHFTGVAIVHMPTGTYRYFSLSPSYEDYGLWNLVDFKKGIIYHHGLGLDGDNVFAEPFASYSGMTKVRKYNSYLIAQPVDIPK